MSKPGVFFGAPKKKVDKEEKIEDTVVEVKPEGQIVTGYIPAYNEVRKAYDMYTIVLDTGSGTCEVSVEHLKFDSEARALMEIKKRYSEDIIKGVKK